MINTTKFAHGIASYPKSWRGIVVSPDKICIQFNEVQCKTRVNRDHKEELELYEAGYNMPIYSHGTNLPFIAVGIPIEVHKEMLLELLKSYKEHVDKFEDKNKLKDFLLDYAFEINKIFNGGMV
jgi:hypothetical protein